MSDLQQTLCKLQLNWKKSIEYGKSIKTKIQDISRETNKNLQQITKFNQNNIQIQDQCSKKEVELKSITEENNRIAYKLQKNQIKIKEYQRKQQIYEDMNSKVEQHYQQLVRKIQCTVQKIDEAKSQELYLVKQQQSLIIDDQLRIVKQQQEIIAKQKEFSRITNTIKSLQDRIWTIQRLNKAKKQQSKALRSQKQNYCSQNIKYQINKPHNQKQIYKSKRLKDNQLNQRINELCQQIIILEHGLTSIWQKEQDIQKQVKEQTEILRECKKYKHQSQLIKKLNQNNL